MAVEIERKFLVAGDGWRGGVKRSSELRQAYLRRGGRASVRVRIRDGVRATLTIKSASAGPTRDEFEYEIPVVDADRMMTLRDGAAIEKTRHDVPIGPHVWEIDVFSGDNDGLVVAEIELDRVDAPFERPDWLGAEVTDDRRYYNSALVSRPYKDWRAG